MNNRTAARAGRRAALEALRDTLAEQLDTTTAQIHAQLAAQYRATLADIAELADDEPEGGAVADTNGSPDEQWSPV